MEIFNIKNLDFTYPEQKNKSLVSIDLTIQRGDFVVIFGETGSGKSTLLKMLKPELTPYGEKGGLITYKGKALEEWNDRTTASEIGYVMQKPQTQIVTDKVWHELAFGLENMGVETNIIRRRVGEIANFFGIHSWFRKKTTELSGGQMQLLNLAAIMVMQPKVLILDEPTSQLDPIAATNFTQMLERINQDLGLTIIIVEHQLEEVLPLANKVILLEEGKILLTGEPRSIGGQLNQLDASHKMFYAFPTAAKVYYGLNYHETSPLTIHEGRDFLIENFNEIEKLQPLKKSVRNNSKTAIELKNIWFRYERKLSDVVRGTNLKVCQGEIMSILGGNGSGKTTLLNIIAGSLKAYRGDVLINGKKIQKYKNKELYKHNIAVLPQDPQTIFLKQTVYEDYQEIAKAIDYSEKEMKNLIREISMKLEIQHLLEENPYDLSGGEQQKVALGKILLLQPQILLLDEPTKGIDAFSKQNLVEIIQKLQSQGITIFIVTHDVEFSARVSDQVGLYFDGEVISTDTPTEFFSTNNYYTTAASLMSRHLFHKAITDTEIISICREQQRENNYEKTMD